MLPFALCKSWHIPLSAFPCPAQAAGLPEQLLVSAWSVLFSSSPSPLALAPHCSTPGNSRPGTSRDPFPWPREALGSPLHTFPAGLLQTFGVPGLRDHSQCSTGELEPVLRIGTDGRGHWKPSRDVGRSCYGRCSQGSPSPAH